MKKFPQLLVTIAVFIGSTIGIDFLVGWLTTMDITGAYLTSFGSFPGQTGLTYIENYVGFLQADTLGWFTYVLSGASQSLETLASGMTVVGSGLGAYLAYNPSMTPVIGDGIIPIMIEFHPWSSNPTLFMPALIALIRLLVPFLITGIVAGAVAKEKKDAIRNALLAFVVVGAAGVVLNIFHLSYNFVLSVEWKFDAFIMLNPAFFSFQNQIETTIAMLPEPNRSLSLAVMLFPFTLNISIVAMIYALINGLIISILAVLVAAKK
ncbi:MAG: hypothetical protein JW839_16050 [Candidatus Lokiarchaeota archaeon]|nr:hypothetical protein [Candidatus Lokiarchaeota archaeon]